MVPQSKTILSFVKIHCAPTIICQFWWILIYIIKIINSLTLVKAQWVKCSLGKHQNLSLNPT